MKQLKVLTPLLALCLFFTVDPADAQLLVGPEFSYQGNLAENGEAANGMFAMEFRLYSSFDSVDPMFLEGTQNFAAVAVDNGIFSVELDFGESAFNGEARWLEIIVDGVMLQPRQPITATPYSTFSNNTRGLHVGSGGNIGMGTDSPERVLHTVGDAILVERDVADSAVILRHTGDGLIQGLIGIRPTGTDEGAMIITDADQDVVMSLRDDKVGVGTLSPEVDFHVEDGSVGNITVNPNTTGLFERSSTNYITILSPNNTQRGILLGDPQTPAGGGIIYNNSSTPDGFQFRNNDNDTRMVIDRDGYIGIGRMTPVVDEPTGQSWFDVTVPANGDQVGGMYINNENVGQRTVYGFASGGTGKAVMSYDDQFNTWVVDVGPSVFDELVVKGDTGRVGIGTFNPAFTLDVNGSARVAGNFETTDLTPCKPNGGSWASCSDRRYKKNINDLGGTLDRLLQLRGVTFEYKDPDSINESPGIKIGMIAQEVEKVFPNWVMEKSDGYKLLAPSGFEALAVEALRELRKEKDQQLAKIQQEKDDQVEKLQDENDELRHRLELLEAAVANLMSK